MSVTNILIVMTIILCGFSFYVIYASRVREGSWKIYNFFIAGQQLPPHLAGQVYWGNSLALGNGIVFFATLTVFWGPAALWVQVPWCIGMYILGRYAAPHIALATQKHTIHGFLDFNIGFKSRYIASVVTSFGFILNMGFEVMVGATLLTLLASREDLMLPALLILALFFAAYCNIGGYRANAKTDKIQNILGLIVVSTLVIYIWSFWRPGSELSNIINISIGSFLSDLFDFSDIPIWGFVSMCLYAFFVQFCDMSNWQNISATSKSGGAWKTDIEKNFKKAALLAFIVPGLLCVLLAYPFIGTGSQGEQFLANILTTVLPVDTALSGVLWGLVLFVLLGTMQSTADSFLMASSQTLSWDVFDRKRVDKVIDNYEAPELTSKIDENNEEYRITQRARLAMFPAAVVGTLSLYYLMVYGLNIIQLMFLIFGSQLSLLPALSLSLYAQKNGLRFSKGLKALSAISIVVGFLSCISTIYLNSYIEGVVDLASFFALLPSIFVAGLGFIIFGFEAKSE